MKDGSAYGGLPGVGNTKSYALTKSQGHYEKAAVFVVLRDGTVCKQAAGNARFEVCAS